MSLIGSLALGSLAPILGSVGLGSLVGDSLQNIPGIPADIIGS